MNATGCPRSGFSDLGFSGFVEKRDLWRMPRESFPVHIDTMPANEIDGLVIPMADFAVRIDFSVAGHAAWSSRTSDKSSSTLSWTTLAAMRPRGPRSSRTSP